MKAFAAEHGAARRPVQARQAQPLRGVGGDQR
jgi:hypothetical protein